MVATKTSSTATKKAVMVTAHHSGGTGKPLAPALRRLLKAFHTSRADSTPPSSQLSVGPSEPSSPPPKSRKVASVMGCVLPSATRKAAPRKDIRPPSVTTKDGTPR